ncbi:MAG TPA: CDP-diacylglycerol--serine O-phosphatidyltransferase [Myxococcales bacterium]
MHARHLVPNAVTLANITFGFLSIVASAQGRFQHACYLVFFAALCDMLDGRLARMLNATSKFGMELDSLSDAISFGVAPAFLVYLSSLKDLGAAGLAISVLFTLCGVLRLARFNVTTSELSKFTFLGCPIPAAAGYLLSMVMVRESMPLWLVAFGTTFVGLSMVSTIKVPKFGSKGGPLPGVMLWIAAPTFIALLARPSALTWHLWNGWNLVMLATNYVQLYRLGHIGHRHAVPVAAGAAALAPGSAAAGGEEDRGLAQTLEK